LLGLIGLIIAN